MGFGRGFGGKLPRGYQRSLESTFTTTASFNTYTASNGNGTGNGIFSGSEDGTQIATASVLFSGSAPDARILNVVGVAELSGGLIHKRFVRTGDYTVTTADYYLAADSTGGSFTFSLPDAATAADGQTWVFKDEGGVAPAQNIIISCSVPGQTIDGQGQVKLESAYASIQIYTDGLTRFYIF